MKHITKRQEPDAFTQWKNMENEDWQPTYQEVSGEVKRALKQGLMEEQGYICCYCEQRLVESDCHVEHFQPQNDNTADPLDYSNMLCSCQSRLNKGEPRHCGNLKGDWFDPVLLVSPLDPDCESRFIYTSSGSIKPVNEGDAGAVTTIRELGLDISKLNSLREAALEPFLDDTLSEVEVGEFVTGYLRKDDKNEYSEFWAMIKVMFGSYIAV